MQHNRQMGSSGRGGYIPDEIVAEVRERTDIVGVIGSYVELKRSGANHKGRCPFHQEKTPSFNVNSARQFFHCFGCQESGDVFKFLMKIDGRTFTEVVEDLAERAGVALPRLSSAQAKQAAERRSDRQRALELNRRVAQLYRHLLRDQVGEIARAYLVERGIGDEVAETFALGYAPASGDWVVRALKKAGIAEDLAVHLGLIGPRRDGKGFFDRFWNRLIFPLLSVRGEILGFGGRWLGEGESPKYINTPETTLYRKGDALYGIHAASTAIRQRDLVLLVEGNIDVIQLHQAGFTHAVAPMGTALTSGQLRLLARFTQKVVALFDGDAAGQAAAQKAVPLLVEAGLEARIASLPAGEDPDSLLVKRGAPALDEIITQARPAIDYYAQTLVRRMQDDSVPARARVLEDVALIVRKLPSGVARDLYAERLSVLLGIERGIVDRVLRGQRVSSERVSSHRAPETEAGTPSRPAEMGPAPDPAEVEPLGLLLAYPHLFARAEKRGLIDLLTNADLRATYLMAMDVQRVSGSVDAAPLLERVAPPTRDAVAQVLFADRFTAMTDPTQALDDYLTALRRKRLKQERAEVCAQMRRAQTEGDSSVLRALGLKLIDVEREIHDAR